MTTETFKPFTASEVRANAAFRRKTEPELANMLHAYADMLEAREKAVPVYQHRSKNGPMLRWFDCSEETFMAMEHNEHDREHFDRRILYTHPVPAGTERLAEALRWYQAQVADCRKITQEGNNARHALDADGGKRAAGALAAHSAQAQPPVPKLNIRCETNDGRVVGTTYPDVVRVETEDDGSFTAVTNFWPQPPAASVTDAMVERAFDKLLADGLDDLDRPKIEGMRAALEAALATQGHPQ